MFVCFLFALIITLLRWKNHKWHFVSTSRLCFSLPVFINSKMSTLVVFSSLFFYCPDTTAVVVCQSQSNVHLFYPQDVTEAKSLTVVLACCSVYVFNLILLCNVVWCVLPLLCVPHVLCLFCYFCRPNLPCRDGCVTMSICPLLLASNLHKNSVSPTPLQVLLIVARWSLLLTTHWGCRSSHCYVLCYSHKSNWKHNTIVCFLQISILLIVVVSTITICTILHVTRKYLL